MAPTVEEEISGALLLKISQRAPACMRQVVGTPRTAKLGAHEIVSGARRRSVGISSTEKNWLRFANLPKIALLAFCTH